MARKKLAKTEAKKNSYWSVDEQVFYLDGSAWGLDKQLRTVYMGKESEILKEHPAK